MGCFQLGMLMNIGGYAAMNILMHAFWCFLLAAHVYVVLLGMNLEMELLLIGSACDQF